MKKFLQKSCHWLVMLIAWFAVSATAMAQDATFTYSVTGKNLVLQKQTENGIETNFFPYNGPANTYSNTCPVTFKCSTALITKIVLHGNGMFYTKVQNTNQYLSLSEDGSESVWEGSASEISIVDSGDAYIHSAEVWLEGSGDTGEDDGSIKSTLNFDNWNLTYSGGSSKPASSTHFNNGEVFSNAEGVTMTLTNIPDPQSWPSECFYSNPSGSTMALYLCNGEGFTIAAPAGYTLSKILVSSASSNYSMTSLIIDGVQNTDAAKGTWEGEAASVAFSTISGDATKRILVSNIKVTLVPAAAEDTNYTLEFVDAPEGAAVTIDGTTYYEDASWTVAKYLNLGSITNVVEPDGYYAEKEYDATDHKFTVTYKHWITYNVSVTGHMMGALEYNGNYYSADGTSSFQSKTVINDEEFKAYKLNGYDGTVSVTQESDYVYNVSVTYTESAPITYSVVFNTVPEGAYAWINGVKYEANGTFQTNLELSNSSLQEVYCPEGYYDNSYYIADDHTFYINYIEYDKYYVVVEGTEDANAGVKYGYKTYHNGDIIYTNVTIYDYFLNPVEVAGYEVEVSLEDHTITVSYTKASYIDISMSTSVGNGNSFSASDDENVVTVSATAYYSIANIYSGHTMTISCASGYSMTKIELKDNNGTNIPAGYGALASENGSYYAGVWTGDANRVVIGPASEYDDFFVSKVRVYLQEAAPVEREKVMEVASTYFSTGEVTEIKSGLTFVTTVNTEGAHYGGDTPNEVPEGVTLKDDNNVIYTISNVLWWDNDNQVAINLPAAITTPGHYTLTIPEGVIPCVGNKTNKEIVFEWTVLDPVVGHLAMSDAGYATLCVNYAYTLPEGYTAYAAGKDVNGTATLVGEDGSIILNPLNSVAANVPVIIEGPEADDVTLLRASSASAPAVNFLVGFTYEANNWSISNTFGTDWCPGSPMDYDTYSNFSIYQLANEEGKVGFYRQKAEEGKFYCAANKAVLIVPAPDAESNARFLLPGQDVITGIDAIATEAAESIYNLQGQRVIAPAKGGVYVKNGKKIIVK